MAKAKAKAKGGKARAAKAKRPRTAADAVQTEERVVETAAGRALVRCVVDTVDLLHRQGRIDDVDRRAGDRYRRAFDAAMALPSILDPERVAGGGGGRGVASAEAAGRLAEAHRALGVHGPVVTMVVGHGHSVEDLARRYAGEGVAPSRGDRVRASHAVRTGLRILARLWWPAEAGGCLVGGSLADDPQEAKGVVRPTVAGASARLLHAAVKACA